MSPQDAVQIWRFVHKYIDRARTIVCHCEQGMSRSPAVALALAERLDGVTETILAHGQPNQYVYRLMREAISHIEGKTEER